MKYFFLLMVLFAIISCRHDNKSVAIQQFYPFNKMTDTFYSLKQMITAKDDYFLVSNFRDDSSTTAYIDSFVSKHINATLLKYNYYIMYFYKETSYTNLVKIAKNSREIDRYSNSHDLVLKYKWLEGKFYGREKIKNGEVVDPVQKKLKFTIKQTPDSVTKGE